MTPEFAEAVDPLYLHVLNLLDRISLGEHPSAQDERAKIRGYLDQAQGKLGQKPEWLLAKYALVSWIDEVLIEVDWGGREWWNNYAMEVELFNTRLCNELFYVQAKEASTLHNKDALEVFYVCVVLGFRGLYRDSNAAASLAEPRGLPPTLESWMRQTALAIQLGGGGPPIKETVTAGEVAMPLEGPFLLIASALVAVVLTAVDVILGYIVFFP